MQLQLNVDLAGQTPDVILALVYASTDNGNRFTYTGTGSIVQTILDGSKTMTQAEYGAIAALPYVLKFAVPPVAPTPPVP